MASETPCDANHLKVQELTLIRLVGPEVASQTAFEGAAEEDADEAGPRVRTTEIEDVTEISTSGIAIDFERTGVGNAIANVTVTEIGIEGIRIETGARRLLEEDARRHETSGTGTETALLDRMQTGHDETLETAHQ